MPAPRFSSMPIIFPLSSILIFSRGLRFFFICNRALPMLRSSSLSKQTFRAPIHDLHTNRWDNERSLPISKRFQTDIAYMCTCLEQRKLRIRKLHQVVDRSTFIDRNIPLESVKSSFKSSPVRFDLCLRFIKRSIRIFVVLETVFQSLVTRF